MSYVPIVPHVPEPPSPRARELADRLALVLREYEDTHPSVTAAEMRQATRLALQATRTSSLSVTPVAVALVGVLVLGVLITIFVAPGSVGGLTGRVSLTWVVAALAVVGALIAVLRRRP